MRAFREEEKEQITHSLIEIGKKRFAAQGLKKTSIKELTDAVGIAQGSFYLFFHSKEEFYFYICEQEEQTIKQEILKETSKEDMLTEERFVDILLKGLALIDANPIIKRLYFEDERSLLLRKLPKEVMEKHMKEDEHALFPLFMKLKEQKKAKSLPIELFGSVIRSFFLLMLHKHEIGEHLYDETAHFYALALSKQLFSDDVINHD